MTATDDLNEQIEARERDVRHLESEWTRVTEGYRTAKRLAKQAKADAKKAKKQRKRARNALAEAREVLQELYGQRANADEKGAAHDVQELKVAASPERKRRPKKSATPAASTDKAPVQPVAAPETPEKTEAP